MAEVKIVVTSGRRGIGINRKGRRDPRMVAMVCILIWVVFMFINLWKNISSFTVLYSTLYLNKLIDYKQSSDGIQILPCP